MKNIDVLAEIDENQSEPLTPEEAYLRLKQLVEQ